MKMSSLLHLRKQTCCAKLDKSISSCIVYCVLFFAMILFDNHVMSYIQESLQKCHEQRVIIYYYILNVGIVVVFIIFGIIYLYYAFTTKLSPEELYKRRIQDKEYVLYQIRRYQDQQKKMEDTLTSLPILDRRRGEEEMVMRPVIYS